MSHSEALLELRGITKRFPGVVANDDIGLTVREGEIHGLLGENGAGKSTLMKVLYGLHSPDAGEIRIRGQPATLGSPQDAIDAGIGMVHQHFMFVPRLTVVENIVLGEREPADVFTEDGALGGLGPLTELGRMLSLGLSRPRDRLESLVKEYGLDIDLDVPVWELGVGERQRVEIVKALYRDVDVLILDEPTAVLTPTEAEKMFETLQRLVDKGLTIIFITHKLDEAIEVTDRISVLRDGRRVDTIPTEKATRSELARLMVGREVLFDVDADPVSLGEPVLEATGLETTGNRQDLGGVDLQVRAGEIVGIAGVSGNGQRELAECLVGLEMPTGGNVVVGEEDLTAMGPRAFVENGVAYVPEDRHERGCAPDQSVARNAVLKNFREFSDNGMMDYDGVEAYAESLVEKFDIRGVPDTGTATGGLSGGNLQKLIVGRELDGDPDVLVANQPTRGVDVGAIESLQNYILDQREAGTGVVLFSEDLDEILNLSDRVLVMYEGEFVYESTAEEVDHERVGLEMTGGEAVAADGGG
jgi:simple sugar transport system ATP-binding protein